LNRQLGIVNFAPLKEHFLTLANATVGYLPSLPSLLSIPIYLHRSYTNERDSKEMDAPALPFPLSSLAEQLKTANKSVTGGKFAQALKEFTAILHTVPFVVVERRAQVSELLEFVHICREYILAIRIELKRKETQDPVQQAVLASYFTATKIQPIHLVLGLRSAIKLTSAVKAFVFCSTLCRRLLEICQTSNNPTLNQLADPHKIRSFLAMCERAGTDAVVIPWPDDGGFGVCGWSFEAVGRGQGVKCPFCVAVYKTEYSGQLCQGCGVAKIGADGTGLRCYPD
jgi:coatomer protein complex subunit alpha (xenin)